MSFSCIFFLAAAISTLAADPDPVQTCKTSCSKGTEAYFCSLSDGQKRCQCPTDSPHLASRWESDDGVSFVCGSSSSTNDATETDLGKCRISCFNTVPGGGNSNFCQTLKGDCVCYTTYLAAQTSIDSDSFCGAITCKSGCAAKGNKWFCKTQNDAYCGTQVDSTKALDIIKNKNYLSCEVASYPGEAVSFDIRNMCATEKRYAKYNQYCAKAGSCIGYQALDSATLDKMGGDGYACGNVQSGTAVTTPPPPDPIQTCMTKCKTYTYFCPVHSGKDYCACPTTDSALTDAFDAAISDVFGCGEMGKVSGGLTVDDLPKCMTQCFGQSLTGDASYCYANDGKCTCPTSIAAMQKAIHGDDGNFCGILTCQSGCQAKDDEAYFCRKGSKEACACVEDFAHVETSITGDDHYLSCESTAESHKAVPEGIANDCAQSEKKKGNSYYCVKTADDCQGFTGFPATFIENLLRNNYSCGSVANSWVGTTTTTTTKAPDPIQHCAGFCPPPAKYFCAVERTSNECPCPYNGDALTKMLKSSLSNMFGCAVKGVIPDTETVEVVAKCMDHCFGQTSTGNISYCHDPKDQTTCTCPKSMDDTQKGIDADKFCGMLTCQVGSRVRGDNYFCEKDSSGTCTGAAAFTDAKALISGNDHYFSCELADESHVAIPHDARVRCATSKQTAGSKYYCVDITDDCLGYPDDTQIQAQLDKGYACGSVQAQIVCQGSCRERKAAYFCTKEDGTCECETDDTAVETALITNHRVSCQATDASVAVITFDALEKCEKTATQAGQTGHCCGCGPTYKPFCALCDDVKGTLPDTLAAGTAVGYFATN